MAFTFSFSSGVGSGGGGGGGVLDVRFICVNCPDHQPLLITGGCHVPLTVIHDALAGPRDRF